MCIPSQSEVPASSKDVLSVANMWGVLMFSGVAAMNEADCMGPCARQAY